MKIKFLFLLLLVLISTATLKAQKSNIKGVVRYEHNDYVGYRADVGAEIYVISVQKADSVDISKCKKYEECAKDYMKYKIEKADPDNRYIDDSMLRLISGFYKADEEALNDLDSYFFNQSSFIKENAEYIELVDESGKYSIELPYGEYYFLAKSNNRDRSLMSELMGRVLIEKVTIDKPSKIISFDFCY